MILPSGLAAGWPSAPIIIGMLGPVMSASSKPTEAPALARATARLTLTVVLPTPPLPEPTAMMFFTPGSSCGPAGVVARRTAEVHVKSIFSAPIGRSAASMRDWISSLSGHAGVVSSTVNDTLVPSIARSLTMFREIRLPPSSGS